MAKQESKPEDKGKNNKACQSQSPVEVQKNCQNACEDKNILEYRDDDRFEHLIQVFNIIGHPRYQTSHRVSIKKAHRLRLHPSEQLETNILHDILADEFQDIILRKAQPEGNKQNANKSYPHYGDSV